MTRAESQHTGCCSSDSGYRILSIWSTQQESSSVQQGKCGADVKPAGNKREHSKFLHTLHLSGCFCLSTRQICFSAKATCQVVLSQLVFGVDKDFLCIAYFNELAQVKVGRTV